MSKEHRKHLSFQSFLITDNHLSVVGTPADDFVILMLLEDGVELDDELSDAVLDADHVQKIMAHRYYTIE